VTVNDAPSGDTDSPGESPNVVADDAKGTDVRPSNPVGSSCDDEVQRDSVLGLEEEFRSWP
jgi:hypothetical protein